jgi:hypothetical protein
MLPSQNPLDYPSLVLVGSFSAFWISARVGAYFRERKQNPLSGDDHEDFALLLGGALTLLGLIIGFTFSMAVSRYDQRKNFEEQEANAIGTEYVRADLLPPADMAKVRGMLLGYLDLRVLDYKTRNEAQVGQINRQTAHLQTEMWSAVATPAASQSLSPVIALAVSGMNDVLNSQGYTQAAWWNRIPIAAWIFLVMISIFCNVLVGYVAHRNSTFRFLILPIALSISLFLIADIDSPRGGVIRLRPQNLEALSESLHPK